ncbi:MAG: sensor histidine kinase [Tidjanibacter sp.]|nr:sensor histidine kinase [Tidjanibacter sp.]
MKDIAFHITDVSENCIRAGATEMTISLVLQGSVLTLVIADNGCGMTPETVARATDPFYTTRTTRKVGLGLPFLIQNAEQCGGSVKVASQVGVGTTVTATFHTDNIDCPPVGDVPETLMQIISGNPQIDTHVEFRSCEQEFSVSTSEIADVLEGLPLGHPQVATMIRAIVDDNFKAVFGKSLNF